MFLAEGRYIPVYDSDIPGTTEPLKQLDYNTRPITTPPAPAVAGLNKADVRASLHVNIIILSQWNKFRLICRSQMFTCSVTRTSAC